LHPEIVGAESDAFDLLVTEHIPGARHCAPATQGTTYLAATPHIDGSDNATVRLDNQNETQPDLLLCIDRAQGGRSFISSDDYIEGAPELIVEIAGTSASYDLHDKKLVYARHCVREYLVVLTYAQTLHWFVLRQGEFEEMEADNAGILRSECFPGLWLNSKAFWKNDLPGMLATLQEGLASAEHDAFVATLGDAEVLVRAR